VDQPEVSDSDEDDSVWMEVDEAAALIDESLEMFSEDGSDEDQEDSDL